MSLAMVTYEIEDLENPLASVDFEELVDSIVFDGYDYVPTEYEINIYNSYHSGLDSEPIMTFKVDPYGDFGVTAEDIMNKREDLGYED